VHCIERARVLRHGRSVGLLLLLAACSSPMPPDRPLNPSRPMPPSAAPAPEAAVNPPPARSLTPAPAAQAVRLPPPAAVRNAAELRLQAARRLVAANPDMTYTGAVPDILLAIPVLEVELHADGQVRRIDVLRKPKQAPDTTQLAIAAVQRAAPYGDVSRLPKPWRFTETFLFNDDRKFKPRTLD